jgi:hypothetical protein
VFAAASDPPRHTGTSPQFRLWHTDSSAARNAATKMKIEYDRVEPDAKAGECWPECEALWDALVPFAEIDFDAS